MSSGDPPPCDICRGYHFGCCNPNAHSSNQSFRDVVTLSKEPFQVDKGLAKEVSESVTELATSFVKFERPSFDQVFMEFASLLARRSTCARANVGCVVVTWDNNRILSMGYNGGAKGVFNECLSSEPGKCGHLHAEINALVKMNFNEAAGKRMYTTTVPCFACAVAIINAGISEVVYLNEYRLMDGVELLQKAGIVVRKHGV